MSGNIRLNVPVFLAVSYLTFTNKPSQHWSYSTEFQEILTWFRGIIYAVNAQIEIATAHYFSEWQSDKCREVGNFASFLPLNWLPWQRPLRYWKKISDLSATPTTLSYGVKIAKITHGLCFAYDTKLVAMATLLRNRKNWTGSRKFTQIPSIWWKDRENGPIDSEIALLIVKTK